LIIQKEKRLIFEYPTNNLITMKVILLMAGVFVGLTTIAQTTAELDKKNGFREFTIGTEISSIETEIQFIKKLESAETRLFKVKEAAIINGMSGEVELVFYKDRLVEITVFFKQKTLDDYNSLKESLTQLYGAPNDASKSKTKPAYLSAYDKILIWKGAVIGLQYNYDVSHKVIEVIYWGLNEKTDKAKEEF